MSKIYDATIQQQIRDYITTQDVSQTKLAAMTGIGKGTMSQYMNSSYVNGDPAAIEKKITEFFRTTSARAQAEQAAAPYIIERGYVPTTVSEDVYQSILFAQLNRCMAVLQGDAGVGKTKGAVKFARDHPNSAIYIKVTPTDASITGVVYLLAKKMNIRDVHGRRQIMEAVLEKLANTNKVVIVDEAQFLNSMAIDLLRTISDGDEESENLGNGICLIGNSTIKRKIQVKADNGLAQLDTRVKLPREYYTTQTTRGDVDALFPLLAQQGKEKELKFLHSISRSSASTRKAVSIFDNAAREGDVGFENLRKWAAQMGVGVVA